MGRMELVMQPRLELRLKMAPQIIQSIEILQLPLLALQARIEQEQLENPVLELEESRRMDEFAEPARDLTRAEQAEVKDDFRKVVDISDDFHDYFWQTAPRQKRSSDKDAKLEALQNAPGPQPSLRDHLLDQIRFFDLSPRMREICEAIINNLDRDGRLVYPLEEIVNSLDDVPSMEEASGALDVVQSLDPTGVGARDLQDCLLLQLDRTDQDYELQRELILHHLEDIEANRFPHIARATKRDLDDVKRAIAAVCILHPAPGRPLWPVG